jgi:hypothetical protein
LRRKKRSKTVMKISEEEVASEEAAEVEVHSEVVAEVETAELALLLVPANLVKTQKTTSTKAVMMKLLASPKTPMLLDATTRRRT